MTHSMHWHTAQIGWRPERQVDGHALYVEHEMRDRAMEHFVNALEDWLADQDLDLIEYNSSEPANAKTGDGYAPGHLVLWSDALFEVDAHELRDKLVELGTAAQQYAEERAAFDKVHVGDFLARLQGQVPPVGES